MFNIIKLLEYKHPNTEPKETEQDSHKEVETEETEEV